MKNNADNNAETISLKNIEEKKDINTFEIPQNLNNYFQTIDLKDLSSYEIQPSQEINNSDTLFGNNYFNYFMKSKLLNKDTSRKRPQKLGNLYSYLFIRNQPLFTIGTKKLNLVLIYQFFLHFSFIFIHFRIIHGVFPYMQYLLTIFYVMNFLNHMYLFLLNPGIPSPDSFSKIAIKNIQKEDRKYFKVCEICNIIVDNYDDVRHCTECNICIKKLDHHCYWTGKCIAKNNYFTFQMFTFTTLLYYAWYAIVFVVWCIININKAKQKHKL